MVGLSTVFCNIYTMTSTGVDSVPGMAAEAVLASSQELDPDTDKVSGYDFNRGIDHHELLKSFKYSGFQATNFGLAVEEIWKMIRCREENIPADKLEIRYQFQATHYSTISSLTRVVAVR